MGRTSRTSFCVCLLIVASAEGARIFRNPEPHLPAENLPPEQRGYVSSRPEEESFFAPDAWRPVTEFSGRRQLASSAVDLPLASSRNLRLDDQRSAAENGTPRPSANSPSTTLGQSIALVANQLLQGGDDVESRTPEGSTTTSSGWSQDIRTPPKVMLQVNKLSDDEPGKKPIKDNPVDENFFPSRRHPPQQGTITPGLTVTQMLVTSKLGENTVSSTTERESTVRNRPTTPSLLVNKLSTSAKTTTASIQVSTPTTPTSVKWKIAMPMNRPTRFPPRKPITTTAAPSKITSFDDTIKPTNLTPSSSTEGNARPNSPPPKVNIKQTTTTRNVPTTNPITTPSTSAIELKKPTASPTLLTTKPTTITPIPVTTTSAPIVTTTIQTTESTSTKKNITSVTQSKEKNTDVLAKNSETHKQEILSDSKITKVEKNDSTKNDVNNKESENTTTSQPQRPSNKRKKNKNRRRRPSKKPTNQPTISPEFSGTELEVKESPQEGGPGSAASPLSTRIYNFIAREVMPSMSVGLLGLVVTAGLAGYFLLPTLGGLQRRSDTVADGLTVYGSGGAYEDQEEGGGLITSIFQNVMASVRNGEKEFERGPRRRRNVAPTLEAENEVDAVLPENKDKFSQNNLPSSLETTTLQASSTLKYTSTEPSISEDGVTRVDIETESSTGNEEATTTEGTKNVNPMQDLIPSYYWDSTYDDNPFSLSGIFRKVVDFKLRIGVNLLRATTEVIARYLEDVQKRLRDSDRHDWLRSLGSSIRRIGRDIDSVMNTVNDSRNVHLSKSLTRRTKRHG